MTIRQRMNSIVPARRRMTATAVHNRITRNRLCCAARSPFSALVSLIIAPTMTPKQTPSKTAPGTARVQSPFPPRFRSVINQAPGNSPNDQGAFRRLSRVVRRLVKRVHHSLLTVPIHWSVRDQPFVECDLLKPPFMSSCPAGRLLLSFYACHRRWCATCSPDSTPSRWNRGTMRSSAKRKVNQGSW